MRPITIRSRYEQAECTECGGTITLDFGPEGYDGDPIEVAEDGGHEDDCPKAPADPAPAPLSIQVRAALNGYEWIAFVPTCAELTAIPHRLGLAYGKTRYEAASKMLGCLDQLGWLEGRTVPIVFVED